MRAIAGEAGVDPALIRHFFGDKATLFVTTMTSRTSVFGTMGAAFAVEPAERGRSVVGAYLELWEDPATGPVLAALVRSALGSPEAATIMSRAVSLQMCQMLGVPDEDDADLSAFYLVAAQMLGVAIARYVGKVEPVARLEQAEVVDRLAPVIQAALDEAEREQGPAVLGEGAR